MSVEAWIYHEGHAIALRDGAPIRYHVTCDVCGKCDLAEDGSYLPGGWHMITVAIAPPLGDGAAATPFGGSSRESREYHTCTSPGCQVLPVHLTVSP